MFSLAGVFTGFSSLSWALSIPDDGKVVACDVSAEYAAIGKPVWKEAGVDHKIDLRIAPAAASLREWLLLKSSIVSKSRMISMLNIPCNLDLNNL